MSIKEIKVVLQFNLLLFYRKLFYHDGNISKK